MITCLPDLFLDLIIKPKGQYKKTGNIRSFVKIKIGGNAANFSIALSKLGIENNLIACCGKISYKIIKKELKKLKINFYPVFTKDNITVSIERGDRIMFTDSRGIQISKITKYLEIIQKSKYIFFGNWNNNKKSNKLLRWLIENSHAKIYLDIGDPSINRENLEELFKILEEGKIWTLSLNEYELKYLCNFIGFKDKNYIELSKKLFNKINVENLDIHSPSFVYSLPSETYIKIKKIKPKILTGAGDTWNAANFFGYYKKFSAIERLDFANKIAKKYITGNF